MRLIHCACSSGISVPGASEWELPEVPGRRDLAFLDEIAAELLPGGAVPSLAEIQASPSVRHLGEPALAGQSPAERLRVVVSGTDAALSAVLTRMMRADYLWAEVAYVPVDPASPAAVLWGAADPVDGPVRPMPCVRSDSGIVVAGSAVLSAADEGPYIGEIVVDNEVLLLNQSPEPVFPGPYGARLVPTVSAPGLAAVSLLSPVSGVRRRFRRSIPPALTGSTVMTGRALQSGGASIAVTIDGTPAPRPLNRVTFYRHLRDIQAVRA